MDKNETGSGDNFGLFCVDDRNRYCPYFEKEIGIELCTYVFACVRGDCNKSLVPEITDWEKAEKLCNDCPHKFD